MPTQVLKNKDKDAVRSQAGGNDRSEAMIKEPATSGLQHLKDRWFLVVAVFIVVLAIVPRVHHIAQRSLWLDEAISANISRGTLAQTLTLTRGLDSAPIVDPVILYVTEKIGNGPFAVRTPALIASVLAVIVMLCFAWVPWIAKETAALSALMLAVSAAQVRYAQEVREYSLSVLYAAIMLYAFSRYISQKEETKQPIWLYLVFFFAPLVQYGLVLYSFGVLLALLVVAVLNKYPRRKLAEIAIAFAALTVGGTISLFLTLRYQLEWGSDQWYLQDYFWNRSSNIVHYAASNTYQLFSFLLPGEDLTKIAVIAMLIFLLDSLYKRTLPPLAILAMTTCGIPLAASIFHRYPYGGIRQCLFLAPVICSLAAESIVWLTKELPRRKGLLALTAIGCVTVVSGIAQIRESKPYAEIENIKPILSALQSSIRPGDNVYVYPNAAYAVDFYIKKRDPRFFFGNEHQEAPEKYVPEMLAGISPAANRVWIVFSHVYRDEDQRILSGLDKDWDVELILSQTRTSLYLARRREPVENTATMYRTRVIDDLSTESPSANPIPDTFWDWNVRNASPSIR
jgi:uncharacterized membrane protein